jgi:pyruvate dehydrogenase E1 component beta subunit
VVADVGWKTCSVAAEVSALVAEHAFEYLKAPIRRVTLPDCPAPASAVLEKVYYRDSRDIVSAVKQVTAKK